MAHAHSDPVQQIHANENDLVARINECERNISALETQLKSFLELKGRLETQLRACRAKSAPINFVPTDILLFIFREIIRDSPRAAGLLLQVCKRWKYFVTNQPTLWSRIVLASHRDIRGLERTTEYVLASVRHSRDIPLDVHLDIDGIRTFSFWDNLVPKFITDPTEYDPTTLSGLRLAVYYWTQSDDGWNRAKPCPLTRLYARAFKGLLEAITGSQGEVMARWKSLRLGYLPFFERSLGGNDNLRLLDHPLPTLQRLSFESEEFVEDPPAILWHTPSLTSIRLNGGGHCGISLLDMVPNCSQVTELSITKLSLEPHLLFTTSLANLQSLCLEFEPNARSNSSLYEQPLRYSRLTSLMLRGQIVVAVVDAIEAPCLEKLLVPQETNTQMVLHVLSRFSTVQALSISIRLPGIGIFCSQLCERYKTVQKVTLVKMEFEGVEDGWNKVNEEDDHKGKEHEESSIADTLNDVRTNGFPSARLIVLYEEDDDDVEWRYYRMGTWCSPL